MAKHDHDFPNAQKSKPAYLYARFSSLAQREGISIERQLGYGASFAKERGWNVVEQLRDDGKSAFKGANRQEGAALYEFELKARNGVFREGAVLVCENVDRLSRQGAKAAAQLIWSLNEAGVDVATYHDGHIYKAGDDGDLMDLLSVIIKGALGKEESFKKSERSKANWTNIHERIANGEKAAFSSQCPQWLEIKDGTYVLNEHRAGVLRQIYSWYCDGLGSLTILNKLNELGEDSWSVSKRFKERNVWTIRYIHKLLMTPAVMGEYVTLKGVTLSRDYYPAVISPEIFYKAQAIREKRRVIGGAERRRTVNLFLGLSKCGLCGGAAVYLKRTRTYKLTTQTGTFTRERKTHAYLKCNSARYKHEVCTNPSHIPYEVIERIVLDKVLPLIAKHKDEKKVIGAFDTKMADIQRDIAVKQTQLDNIVEALAENPTLKAFIKKAAMLEAEVEALTDQLAAVKLQRDIEAAKPAKTKDVELVDQLRSELDNEDEDERFEARAKMTALLNRLLNTININDDRTFTVKVDDGFSATYDADGEAVGFTLSGDRIVDEMNEALQTDDREAVIDEAFKRVQA